MDPRKVLTDVSLTIDLTEYERPTSPAYDLARLRWRRKKGIATENWEAIVNMKWREKYVKLYREEENNGL